MHLYWALASCLTPAPQAAEPEPLFIQAERVIVRPGEELEDAAILVERGVIVAVGTGLAAPEGARVLQGAVACAGFVDPWSSLGLEPRSAKDLGTGPATATAHAYDPWHAPQLRQEALLGGVTSARIQAGMSGAIGGLGAVVHIDLGDSLDAVLLEDACMAATIGVTRGGKQLDVFDRVAEVDQLVGQLDKGQRYRKAWAEYEVELAEWEEEIAEKTKELEDDFKKAKKKRDKELEEAKEKDKEFKEKKYKESKRPKKPKVDPNAAALARVTDGEVPLVVEVHRAAELRGLLEKTAAMDRLRLVVAGATESAPFAEELAEREIPVLLWPAPLGEQRPDEYDAHALDLADRLASAGVEVLIGSGGTAHARELRLLAALAVSHGLDREAALGAITAGPAQAFDVADSIGTLARGRSADILVLDGDPLDTSARLRFVVSRGEVVVP